MNTLKLSVYGSIMPLIVKNSTADISADAGTVITQAALLQSGYFKLVKELLDHVVVFSAVARSVQFHFNVLFSGHFDVFKGSRGRGLHHYPIEALLKFLWLTSDNTLGDKGADRIIDGKWDL